MRRIRAPQMYDLFFEKPQALVDRYLRFELTERISASGEVLTPLSESELWRLKEELEKEAVESVAVCTLHAYAFPQHENILSVIFCEQNYQMSLFRSLPKSSRNAKSTNAPPPPSSTLMSGPSCSGT